MTARHDLVVVGAGILGLATAREILTRRPGLDLIVLEQEPAIAQHQTGHNSGVVHTGIYYAPGSLKARLCRAGSGMLLEFCAEHRIPVERCGKLLIATTAAELPRLEELFRRGTSNGVPDLEQVPADGIRDIEPHAAGLRALHPPDRWPGVAGTQRGLRVFAPRLPVLDPRPWRPGRLAPVARVLADGPPVLADQHRRDVSRPEPASLCRRPSSLSARDRCRRRRARAVRGSGPGRGPERCAGR